jgi:hypothetical protein
MYDLFFVVLQADYNTKTKIKNKSEIGSRKSNFTREVIASAL